MPATGRAAKGAQLQIQTTTTGLFQTVSGLRGISLQGQTRDELDVTHHDTTGDYRVFVNTWIDPGTISLRGLYDPADGTQGGSSTSNGLLYYLIAGSTENWRINPNGSTVNITFAGWVQSMNMDFDFESAQEFDTTIRVSGVITFPSP